MKEIQPVETRPPDQGECVGFDRNRRMVAGDEMYRQLFEHMAEGVAYCEMLFDGGRAVDWIYLSVNGAFERLTGLKGVVGRRVSANEVRARYLAALRAADKNEFTQLLAFVRS